MAALYQFLSELLISNSSPQPGAASRSTLHTLQDGAVEAHFRERVVQASEEV